MQLYFICLLETRFVSIEVDEKAPYSKAKKDEDK